MHTPIRVASATLSLLFALTPGCTDRELRPTAPCTFMANPYDARSFAPPRALDLLFVIDDSSGMEEEREALRAQIQRLVESLATGDPGTGDPRDWFEPIRNIHVGVITGDLGTGGVATATLVGCDAPHGDDGLLLTETLGGDASCSATSPPFRWFGPGSVDTPAEFADDAACVAAVGAGGCSFQQPLEATLQALTPAGSDLRFGVVGGTDTPEPMRLGHGDEANRGFLRHDSVLAVVVLTNEDDCSTPDADLFDVETTDGTNEYPVPTRSGDDGLEPLPALQCATHRGANHAVERFVDGLLALRPGLERRLVFATIAGVDPAVLAANRTTRRWNGATVEAYDYEAVLSDDTMAERVDASGERLVPACARPDPSAPADPDAAHVASPARRLLQVARGVEQAGGRAVVASICHAVDAAAGDHRADFSRAFDALVAGIMSAYDARGCLARPLARSLDDSVECDVLETLPPGLSCASQPGRTFRDRRDDRERCVVTQLVPDAQERDARVPPAGMGWYYDDYTTALFESCSDSERQRQVRFTRGAEPATGAISRVACAPRVYSTPETVDVGSSCASDPARCVLTGDALARLRSRHARADAELFCAEWLGTCQLACAADEDCPGGNVCFDEDAGNTRGVSFCVDPAC